MSRTSITVRIRWEGGHRLPQLEGKCQNLHGHSWNAWITITGTPRPDGTLLDFGDVKGRIQTWVDEHLDHGMMLGSRDVYAHELRQHDLRVHVFGDDQHTNNLDWPTVENVAHCLANLTVATLASHPDPGDATVARVTVAETENNQATVEVHP